jgi:hypothetical protein
MTTEEATAVLTEFPKLDARDAACAGIKSALEEEGHYVLVGYSNGMGLVYVDGIGPLYIVEVHTP